MAACSRGCISIIGRRGRGILPQKPNRGVQSNPILPLSFSLFYGSTTAAYRLRSGDQE